MPSVVVPILKWSDQPQFGRALERFGCGYCVHDTRRPNDSEGQLATKAAEFEANLETAVQQCVANPSLRRAATALAANIRNEAGVVIAASAIECCLCSRVKPSSQADVEFCQRHCVPCNYELRHPKPGVVRTRPGWDIYSEKKPKTMAARLCQALCWLLVLLALLLVAWVWWGGSSS